MYSRLKLGGKVVAGISTILILFIISIGVSYFAISNLIQASQSQSKLLTDLVDAETIKTIALELELYGLAIIIDKELGEVSSGVDENLDKLENKIILYSDKTINNDNNEEKKRLATTASKEIKHLYKLVNVDMRNLVSKKATIEEFTKLKEDIEDIGDDIEAHIFSYNNFIQKEIADEAKSAGEKEKMEYIIFFLGLVSVIIGIIVMFLIRWSINRFAKIILDSAEKVTDGSKQISSGNHELSSRTEEQASSLEETASTLEEITSTVKQTADNSQRATQLATQAVSVAIAGNKLSQEVKGAMGEISESSSKIADIVNLVNEIAFQTNILAINAAIEAAKAGELGKGFAVVAIEVRDLAQRSAEAAKDIKNLIDSSIERVERGGELVQGNTEKLKEISGGIQEVADIMGEISAASKEQYSGIEQINRAVIELDTVTQQNSSLVEEVSAASENMFSETQQIKTIINTHLMENNDDQISKNDHSEKPTYKEIMDDSTFESNITTNNITKNNIKTSNIESKIEFFEENIINTKKNDDVVESILSQGADDNQQGEDF